MPASVLPREIGAGLFRVALIPPGGVSFVYRGGHFSGEEAETLLYEGLPQVHRGCAPRRIWSPAARS